MGFHKTLSASQDAESIRNGDVCFRSQGALGYFPTYTLGAAFAVQLFRQIEKELPTIHEDIASWKFTAIREWLNEKVLPSSGCYAPCV